MITSVSPNKKTHSLGVGRRFLMSCAGIPLAGSGAKAPESERVVKAGPHESRVYQKTRLKRSAAIAIRPVLNKT